ncbi:DUF1705 domain-containing protein [Acidovorax sp. NCPPB 3576]|uniref:DUF1705 domain-containing protein n=1 Tax=Acidovorax sp. NCPPB 3576 TaxID=2940488 RepID=UPI00234A1A77|nr:DUF1705 domain-containing protein [Acidovorax sp. NCPPB 3576]WCM90488.1 DUF1705 domain-containing protein [Acidovorax sp. NCPPB 3576]
MTIAAMRPLTLVALSATWITVSGNTAPIEKLADLGLTIGSSGWQVPIVLLLLVFVGTIGIASLAAWPRILKITLAALLLITAGASHYMGSYGVVMDPTMLTNVLETDVREAGALLSVQAGLKIFLLGVIPATLVYSVAIHFDTAAKQAIKNVGVALLAVICITCLLAISYKDMASLMGGPISSESACKYLFRCSCGNEALRDGVECHSAGWE